MSYNCMKPDSPTSPGAAEPQGAVPPAAAASTGSSAGQPEVRRRFGRLPQETLKCNLGTVLDFSAGGMRVLCRKLPPTRTEVQIGGYELPGRLIGLLVWSKRVGLFKYEVGIQFDKLTPEMSSMLLHIAAANRKRQVI